MADGSKLGTGRLEYGSGGRLWRGSYNWAERGVNTRSERGWGWQQLRIERKTSSKLVPDGSLICVSTGTADTVQDTRHLLTESELRQMLVAIGCEWARE